MTVLENVMIGRHCRTRAKVLGALLRNPATVLEEQQIVALSIMILENMGLADVVNEFAKNLPYGAQRRLEIARALATDPLLLLLDEPAAGMNPQETRELGKTGAEACLTIPPPLCGMLPVRPLVRDAPQCFLCYRWNHTAKYCKTGARCYH
jgi:ABC-type branched-subunit amino acid transport system ATPase component